MEPNFILDICFCSIRRAKRSGKFAVRHDPSIRVLGCFAERDVFIATNYALREELGGWQSRAWRDVKVRARTIWTHLFHTYQPVITTNVHDVVTGAINGKYFKTH
jgi:hypothetical protein